MQRALYLTIRKVLSYKELAEHKWEMNKEMMGTRKGKSRWASLILEKTTA